MKTVSIKNLAIAYSKGRIHFWNMNKDDATNTMHNSNLIGVL